MQTIKDLSLRYVLSVPSGSPDDTSMPLVIFLHGRGSDMNDLAELAPLMDTPGGCRFVFPNAPKAFEPYPGMPMGWTWFTGWPADRESFMASRKRLLTFLEEITARYPTPGGKVVLGGFSQGAMMALDAGFLTEVAVAGIVAMSGALYEEDLVDHPRQTPKVMIVHGTDDDVIPVQAAQRARFLLEGKGIRPVYEEFPMGHQVTAESMASVAGFIRSCLD